MTDMTTAIPAEYRDINIVTTEIKTLQASAQRMALEYAIEIGRRLIEAKEMLQHGEWGSWLKDEVGFSQRTANNYMQLYSEYGSAQNSLFGAEVNSQPVANLSYTKALRLLAIPEEEREEFIKENNVEELSKRELDALIRERDEAKKRAEDLEKDNEKLNKEASASKAEAEKLKSEPEKIRKKLEEAQKEAEKAQAELKQLKEKKPEIPQEELERIGKEAAEKAEKDLEEKIRKAERDAETARAEAETLKKQLKASDKVTARFGVYFENLQKTLNAMLDLIDEKKAEDPDTAAKLKAAAAAVLDSNRKRFD